MSAVAQDPETGQSGRTRNLRGEGRKLRDDILDAADALLSESRNENLLSLRGVAKRVGIAAPSVYLHFRDVDDLKVAVAERGFAGLDRARDAACRAIADPIEALLARSLAYARYGIAHPGRYRLMFGPDLPPALAYDAVESRSRQSFQDLAGSIHRCQEAGLISTSHDPTRLGIEIWAAVHGVVTLRLDRPTFPWPPLDEMVTGIVRRLLQREQ